MNASDQLNLVFRSRWTQPALVTDDVTLSYAELYACAAGIRDWLATQGCQSGDTVALRLPNGWFFAAAYLACILGRYRFVPVNIELNEEDQHYILRRVEARVVVENVMPLASVRSASAAAPAFEFPEGAVAAVFFTSGTTGQPKGVCHTLDALVGNAMAFNESQGLSYRTRLYHVLPMAYMAGFLNTLLSPWLAGGTVVLGSRFRPVEALRFWQRPLAWCANAIWLTPTLAAVLVRTNRDPETARQVGEQFRHVFCGTAPLSPTVRTSFRAAFGCPLQESYGMSEVLFVSAQTREEAEKTCNVGRLLPGVSVSLRAIREGGRDELVVHTPFALAGYLLEQGEGSPLLEDGGMPSGDVGHMENDGTLVITGRLKDLIIRGGLNVSPITIENVLVREAGVLEAAVIGAPHDFWGEAIVACVVAEASLDSATLLASLQKRCVSELGEGMRPDRFVFRKTLPRASTGKVQKHLLAKEFA